MFSLFVLGLLSWFYIVSKWLDGTCKNFVALFLHYRLLVPLRWGDHNGKIGQFSAFSTRNADSFEYSPFLATQKSYMILRC